MLFDATLPRRDALKGLMAVGLIDPFSQSEPLSVVPPEKPFSISLFSKCLQFLNTDELASVAADIGLPGIDLTVRPGGHVKPARVREDLPKVADLFAKKGLTSSMMTTVIKRADDPTTRSILETASKLGIRYYRTDWVSYPASQDLLKGMQDIGRQLTKLARLNQQFNMVGGYQNHAGTQFGAVVWDMAQVMRTINSPHMGCQYDIRHAVVEGGTSWPLGLQLAAPAIRSIAIKDFVWEKVGGKWKIVNVPLGQGMVDFPAYFKLIKQYNIQVPISLHAEHDLGGAEEGHREIKIPRQQVYTAIQQDLKTLQTYLKQAGLT